MSKNLNFNRFSAIILIIVFTLYLCLWPEVGSKKCSKTNFSWGKRVYYDNLINESNIDENGKWLRRQEFVAKYPSKNQEIQSRHWNITYINVTNTSPKCKCFNNMVSLTQGGIGKNFTTLRFLSESSCSLHFNVKIFAKYKP